MTFAWYCQFEFQLFQSKVSLFSSSESGRNEKIKSQMRCFVTPDLITQKTREKLLTIKQCFSLGITN